MAHELHRGATIMRLNFVVATIVLGLAVSSSAQVLTPTVSASGNASELLSRAARMAAENQQRFNRRPPAHDQGWVYGSAPKGTRPTNWR